MTPDERALAPPRALVPSGKLGGDPVDAAQARLDAALSEVTALDAEVEALSLALAAFAAEVARRLAAPDAEARRASSLVRRLQALAEGLSCELARVLEGRTAGRRGRGKRRSGPRGAGRRGASGSDRDRDADRDAEPGPDPDRDRDPDPDPGEIPTLERQAAELKRLYRRLARLLHPDLAPDDAERARLSGLMARANAAYEADDLTALSLMAERLGAGDPPGDFTAEERLAHLGRRIEQLERVAASLSRERDRLRRTETARLQAEARRRAAAGGDYFTESESELADEAAAARADALLRLAAVGRAARDLSSARRKAMSNLTERRAGAVRRAFDPLAESDLVRRSAARLDRARATAPARELARWLEAAAEGAPWEAGLTLLAYLAEASGERPPPAIATAGGLEERWERLRAGWPGAPDLGGALARLPRHLVLGARAGREEVVAGLQLAEAALAAGVRIALDRAPVARLARQVLEALGPAEHCVACRRGVLGIHLLRTRGLDERHGVICPRCGAALRSYWRYGEAEGLEALWPLALSLGHAAEVPVRLGGVTVGFGLLPGAVEGLSARALTDLLEELYLTPYQVALPRGAVRVAAGRGLVAPGARVGGLGRLAFRLGDDAGLTAEGLLELLRTRIERRFRPGG